MVFNLPNYQNYNFKITINNEHLQLASSVNFLGVYIDSKLNWHNHISKLCSQVAKGVGIIGRLRRMLPNYVLRTIYLSLVYPHLSYCSLAWSSTSDTSLKKLVVLQKRAIRHICNSNFCLSIH